MVLQLSISKWFTRWLANCWMWTGFIVSLIHSCSAWLLISHNKTDMKAISVVGILMISGGTTSAVSSWSSWRLPGLGLRLANLHLLLSFVFFYFCVFVFMCLYFVTKKSQSQKSKKIASFIGKLIVSCRICVLKHGCSENTLRRRSYDFKVAKVKRTEGWKLRLWGPLTSIVL